jgi:hypothetical protein
METPGSERVSSGSLSGSKQHSAFILYRWFEYFILFMIFLNSISLALFDYKDRSSLTFYNITVDRVNTVFTLVYATEAMLKIIAYGLFKHKTAYLREKWNIIDFVVAVIG